MEIMNDRYKCTKCNLMYKTNNGLWKHTKKYHGNEVDISVPTGIHKVDTENKKTYKCIKCNKIYNNKTSKYRHQKNCYQNNNEILELKEEINKLKIEMKKKSNKKIINNTNNGMIINNKLVINKIGTENVLELNDMEITDIFNKEIEGVIKLIEFVNFNERLPSNHSFCTTALDSPYLSTYNTDTNTVDKDRKKYFFDDIFSKAIERQEILYKNNKNKFNVSKRKQIEENILNLKKIRNYDFNNKIVREIMKKLNLLSYNKRNIIQRTWRNDIDDDTDDEYFAKLTIEDDEIKEIEYVEIYDNNIPYLKVADKESDISEIESKKLVPKKSVQSKKVEIII